MALFYNVDMMHTTSGVRFRKKLFSEFVIGLTKLLQVVVLKVGHADTPRRPPTSASTRPVVAGRAGDPGHPRDRICRAQSSGADRAQQCALLHRQATA